MKQVKALKIAVVVLILLNAAFLVFHFTRIQKHPPKRGHVQEMIIEKLHFSGQQAADYKELVQVHRKSISRLANERNTIKQKLYTLLDGKNEHEKGQAELIAKLGGIQVEMEAMHYEHFNRIRQLCKPDQLDEFAELQKKLTHIFSQKPPKRRQ
jgi:periplasmic protein CpxP/Spy